MASTTKGISYRLSSPALLSVVLLILLITPVLSCPPSCSCSGTRVDCSGRGLTEIPQNISVGTTHLDLSSNNISTIVSGAFTGLSSLQVLDLHDNGISDAADGAFTGLRALQTLVLKNNSIKTISSDMFTGLMSLHTLDLSNNTIDTIAMGTFIYLPNLVELNLESNTISLIQRDAFIKARSVNTLRLGKNQLTSITAGAFLGLRGVTVLDLSHNTITILPPDAFRGADQLINIDLRYNRIRSIQSNAFRGLPNLQVMDLSDNDINSIPTQALRGIGPSAKNLDLSRNKISIIQTGAFSQFRNLESLNLRENALTTIPKDTFLGLRLVTRLDLSRNNISSVIPGSFAGLNGLQSLDLSHNAIAEVPDMFSFTRPFILRELHINNNPWQCDCALLDLVRWTATTDVDLGNENATVCSSNSFPDLVGVPLVDADPQLEVCVAQSTTTPADVEPRTTTTPPGTTSTSTAPIASGLSTTAVIVIAVVVSVAMVTIVACVLCYLWGRKRRKRQGSGGSRGATLARENAYINPLAAGNFGTFPAVPARSQFQEYELDKKVLDLKDEIGRGAFGVVYLATHHKNVKGVPTEETVVVKTVHAHAREEDRATFVQEIDTTINLGKHPNLLGLVGCCTTSHPPYMVTEYMLYGDLKGFLLKCRKAEEKQKDSMYDINDLNKYQIARQIANGMIFISQAGYVHGDLAARNVLVGEDRVVKIADFGLATDVYERGYQRQDAEQKIPVRWMAPERLLREGRYTSKSDVWSFGVVLYEIATLGNVPYPGLDRHLIEELRSGYREPRPDECTQELYDLMLTCWQWEEDGRPEFQKLYDELDKLMEANSEVSYLQPFGSPDEAIAAGVPAGAYGVSAADKLVTEAQDAAAVIEDLYGVSAVEEVVTEPGEAMRSIGSHEVIEMDDLSSPRKKSVASDQDSLSINEAGSSPTQKEHILDIPETASDLK